jgi:hypothetical protein
MECIVCYEENINFKPLKCNHKLWPFNFYKRTYAPPGISTGANQSPYSLN